MDLTTAVIGFAALVIGLTLKKEPEPFVILAAGIVGMLLFKEAH